MKGGNADRLVGNQNIGQGIRGWFRGTPFRGLKGLEARGGGDEGLKVEGGITFERLQRGFKGASKGLEDLQLRKASRGLQGGFKGASRGLQGLKGASRLEGGLKGGFTFGRLQRKGASRGLQRGLKGEGEGGFEGA